MYRCNDEGAELAGQGDPMTADVWQCACLEARMAGHPRLQYAGLIAKPLSSAFVPWPMAGYVLGTLSITADH